MSEEAPKPLRVVIVDDEAPARSRVRDLLSDCASELPLTVVGEAASGRAAIEMLEREPADSMCACRKWTVSKLRSTCSSSSALRP